MTLKDLIKKFQDGGVEMDYKVNGCVIHPDEQTKSSPVKIAHFLVDHDNQDLVIFFKHAPELIEQPQVGKGEQGVE